MRIVSRIRAPRRAYCPEPHDLWSAALFIAFALFSILWPDTGTLRLGELELPRGYAVAAGLFASAVLALFLGSRDFSGSPRLIRFLRCYYPQAFFAPLFEESILISSRSWGGVPRDALFAKADAAIFGFQPSREFSAAFGHLAWWNELMFAAYFSFYFLLVLTPWIPWFRGDEEEAERESSVLAGFMLVAYVFYALFRVVGPKHYLPDLAAEGLAPLRGGLFRTIEGKILASANTTGAAFPSSHVAVSLMMCCFVARTERRLLPLYALDAALIALATVYLYAHWAVDVAGGMFSTALLVPLFLALHRRLSRKEAGAP